MHLAYKELTGKKPPEEEPQPVTSSLLERVQTHISLRESRYVVTLDILRFFSCLALLIMTLYGILRDTNPSVPLLLQWPIFATYVCTDLPRASHTDSAIGLRYIIIHRSFRVECLADHHGTLEYGSAHILGSLCVSEWRTAMYVCTAR